MRFKKRYIVYIIVIAILIFFQTDYFRMRSSDEEIKEEMSEKGITDLNFYDYEVEGRKMHYVHRGEEGKPLLILIHGTPGSLGAYTGYLADSALIEKTQMVSVDRPGLGFSGFGKTEKSLQEQAACIKPIIDKHPAEKVIILGHSYGGPVVARMAIDYPELIDGMVIVAGSVSPALEPREWWRGPLDLPIIRNLLPPSLKVANQEIMALYDELMEMEPLWDQITCPTVVYQGTEDVLVPPGNANYVDSMLVNSDQKDITFIEGGDHFILWSRMDEIVASTLEMVDGMMVDSTRQAHEGNP